MDAPGGAPRETGAEAEARRRRSRGGALRGASDEIEETRGPRGPGLTWRPPSRPYEAAETDVNDPSAGSPTETLLRLLLPLDSQV